MNYFSAAIALAGMLFTAVKEAQENFGEGTGDLKRQIVLELVEEFILGLGVEAETAVKLKARAAVWLEIFVKFIKPNKK